MVTTKTTTLTLRIDPMIKEGLRLLAEKEHRSLTNTVEVLIREGLLQAAQCRHSRTTLATR